MNLIHIEKICFVPCSHDANEGKDDGFLEAYKEWQKSGVVPVIFEIFAHGKRFQGRFFLNTNFNDSYAELYADGSNEMHRIDINQPVVNFDYGSPLRVFIYINFNEKKLQSHSVRFLCPGPFSCGFYIDPPATHLSF